MTTMMRAAVLYSRDDVRIEMRAIPEIGDGEILVRTRASGICSGDTMSWYVERKAPLVLGHEPAGEIVAIGNGGARDAQGVELRIGDRVAPHHHAPCFDCAHCARGEFVACATWRKTRLDPGGLAEYFRVPVANLRDTLQVSDGMSFEDASLVEPLACVMKSLRRSGLHAGDLLYVIGLGVMGQLHVLAARALGARIVASDFLAPRRALAETNGAVVAHPEQALAIVREASQRDGAEVTICGPGTPLALEHALATTASGGCVVMFTPLEPEAQFLLAHSDFYFRDLRLIASYSCGPHDTLAAHTLLLSGTVSAQKVGATQYCLDDVAAAYADLRAANVIKPIITFPVPSP